MATNISFDFQFKPRTWQQECIDNQTRFTVLALHRRAGKTILSLSEAVLYAMQKVGTYAYICPFLNQATLIAWKPLKDMLNNQLKVIGAPRGFTPFVISESIKTVKFYNGSEIKLLGADNPDSIRGSKLAGCILDEVAQMPNELWSEIVRPALADSHGWALFIGTPKGTNLFSELFDRGNDPKFPEWSARKYTCYQTDALPASEIEAMRLEMSEEEFKREMLCDFDALAFDQFIPTKLVTQSMNCTYAENAFAGYKTIMGVDVARYGDDRSVIFLRKGKVAFKPIYFHGLDLMTLAEQVMRIARDNKVEVINVDGTGVGGGVVDILRSYGQIVYDINFGYKSAHPDCINKRTEMHFLLRQWLMSGGSLPNDSQLKKELTAPIYEKDDQGRFVLESKKAIRKRLGFSPDLADALALTFNDYVPEAPKPVEALFDEFTNTQRVTPNERFEMQIRKRNQAFNSLMERRTQRNWSNWRY